MDHEQAKQLLQLCRPGVEEDLQDPLIAEALACLEHDDKLCEWFDEQQDFDASVCEAVAAIEPPADLQASILVGMRAHRAQAQAAAALAAEAAAAEAEDSSTPTVVPFEAAAERSHAAPASTNQQSFWRKAAIGVAAAVVIMFLVKTVPMSPQTQHADASGESNLAVAGVPNMITYLAGEIGEFKKNASFEKRDEHADVLKSYLTDSGMPIPERIPDELNALPTVGCVTFRYKDAKLSMICFRGEKVYHLITADKGSCGQTYTEQPSIYECNGQSFKTWSEGDKVYILSVEGSRQNFPVGF